MSRSETIDPAEILAELTVRTGSDAISRTALHAAKAVWLDSLVCAVAGQQAPGIRAATGLMLDWGGKPEAPLFFDTVRLPSPSAAFVNSALIHALDFDDVHAPSTLHISSVVVPAICATANAETSGRTLLEALVVGIEVAVRIRLAGGPSHPGFLPSSLAGSFGAVAAAARLEGMDHNKTMDAFGINYAQVSGNRQALLDASLTKRLQPAFSVRSALWAVALARRGISGPHRTFNGDAGFYRLFADGIAPDPEALRRRVGMWEVERVSTKRHPSCGACHAVQAAAEDLHREESIRAENIAAVEMFGTAPLVTEPFEPDREPQVAAQFSAAWAVAQTLLRGPAHLADYTDASIREDREVIELARSIRVASPPPEALRSPPAACTGTPVESAFRLSPQGVVVHTTNGDRFWRARSIADVIPLQPADWPELEAKARDCAGFAGVDKHSMQALADFVAQFDHSGNAGDLLHLLQKLRSKDNTF